MVAIKVQSYFKPVILISCYRAPKKVPSDPLFNEIARITLKYKQNPVWIGGDFNLPDIDWQTKAVVGNSYPKMLNESFLDVLDSCNCDQLVEFSTRK